MLTFTVLGPVTAARGELLTRQAGGYELHVAPESCDLPRFRVFVEVDQDIADAVRAAADRAIALGAAKVMLDGVRRVARWLPADVRSFAGRDRELAELDRLADEPVEILCLEGMPGAGKSTVAVHWAHRRKLRCSFLSTACPALSRFASWRWPVRWWW